MQCKRAEYTGAHLFCGPRRKLGVNVAEGGGGEGKGEVGGFNIN